MPSPVSHTIEIVQHLSAVYVYTMQLNACLVILMHIPLSLCTTRATRLHSCIIYSNIYMVLRVTKVTAADTGTLVRGVAEDLGVLVKTWTNSLYTGILDNHHVEVTGGHPVCGPDPRKM